MGETRRNLVGIGAHVRVCRSSSSRQSGGIGRGATLKIDVVVVLSRVGEDLRRARRVVQVRRSKVDLLLLIVGTNTAFRDAVRTGVCLIDIGRVEGSRCMRWSHSPAV